MYTDTKKCFLTFDEHFRTLRDQSYVCKSLYKDSKWCFLTCNQCFWNLTRSDFSIQNIVYLITPSFSSFDLRFSNLTLLNFCSQVIVYRHQMLFFILWFRLFEPFNVKFVSTRHCIHTPNDVFKYINLCLFYPSLYVCIDL